MRLAVIPGSFDPVTIGHIDLIRRACALFDRVLVTAMVNPEKEYRLTDEQRMLLLRLAVRGFPNAEADLWCGMQWVYLRDRGACAAVKGIRNAKDLQYELEIDAFNRARGMETVFLPADEQFADVSSTEVRRRLDEQESLEGYVTPEAETILREIWSKERQTNGRYPD